MQFELPRKFTISEFQNSDRNHMVENLQDGAVQKWTLLIPYPYTLADADQWLDHLEKSKAADGLATNWAIRNPNGRTIGGIGLHTAVAHQSHAREIGYWIAQDYWGRGIMTGAVQAVVSHAYQQLGITRITAAIFHGNDRSAKVLKKVGFQLEAPLLRKCYLKSGQFIDAILYAWVSETP